MRISDDTPFDGKTTRGRPPLLRGSWSVALIGAATFLLSACNQGQQPSKDDELKRSLDQLVQINRETAATAKDAAGAAKSATEELRRLNERTEALEKAVTMGLSSQKRGALTIALPAETPCDNDELCVATARAICNRINYPNAITMKYTPGVRPTLSSLVCYD